MLRHGRYPKFLRAAHHHQNLRRRLDKMLHYAQTEALEIHHLAADQVGAVEVLIVPRRQLAARHANLGATQGLRLISILHPCQLHRQRTAAAAARLNTVIPPDTAPAYAQIAMVEQALRWVGVRT